MHFVIHTFVGLYDKYHMEALSFRDPKSEKVL